MRRADFTQDAPGQLVRIVAPIGGDATLVDRPGDGSGLASAAVAARGHERGECWAFVPNPLPPALTFDGAMVKRLSEASLALGVLRGYSGIRRLPNPHLLIEAFLRREAVASSRLEGTVTDIRQLIVFEADPPEVSGLDEHDAADREEVSNYVEALAHGLELLRTHPPSLWLIREIHARLMRGARGADKRPGEFRDRQNLIGRAGQSPVEARFVPPPVLQMQQGLDELERFIRSPGDWPVPIELALIHYQFETLHPFLDGNGRLGRILISLLLFARGVLPQPLLDLSAYFERNKAEYVDRLLRVSQAADWDGWLRFFLEGVAIQSSLAVSRSERLLVLRDEYRARLHRVKHSKNARRLVDLLFERPAISVAQVRQRLGITNAAAQQNVEKLVGEGILAEITGRRRNRIYIASGIVEIIEAP